MSGAGVRPGLLVRAAEAVLYAVAFAALAFLAFAAVGVGIGLAVGDVRFGWRVVEYLLFFGGFALLGYAALKLRPSAPQRLPRNRGERAPPPEAGEPSSTDGDGEGHVVREAAPAAPETGTVRTDETRLEAAVMALPPLRGRHLLPDDRLGPHVKQLLAAVLLVVTSGVVHELFVG